MIQKTVFMRIRAGFPSYSKDHTKILLGDFNAKEGRENIFKLTTGNENLCQDNNDNGVRRVNFAT